MIGAQTPIVAAVGNRPTNVDDRPMIAMVMVRIHLRPSLSPMVPKNRPPRGRARNPTAYVAKLRIRA